MMAWTIRPATGADSLEAARVVEVVFAEQGFTWEPDGYCADLYDLQRSYLDEGHRFWVAEDSSGTIVGTCALELFGLIGGDLGAAIVLDGVPRAAGCDCSLERLYLLPSERGKGLGRDLLATAVEEARRIGRVGMEIWSDKRLVQAHGLYLRLGAVLVGERICPGDPDESEEWGLALRLP